MSQITDDEVYALQGVIRGKMAFVVSYETALEALSAAAKARLSTPPVGAETGEVVKRPLPELFSEDERASILRKAETLWEDLQQNNLGGYSGINRPFYILHAFKEVIEKYGHRDVGLSWSKNELDAAALVSQEAGE